MDISSSVGIGGVPAMPEINVGSSEVKLTESEKDLSKAIANLEELKPETTENAGTSEVKLTESKKELSQAIVNLEELKTETTEKKGKGSASGSRRRSLCAINQRI